MDVIFLLVFIIFVLRHAGPMALAHIRQFPPHHTGQRSAILCHQAPLATAAFVSSALAAWHIGECKAVKHML